MAILDWTFRAHEHVSVWGVLSSIIFGHIVYAVGLFAYRIFFHPLARIPGPKLAAASYWYEVYYDVFQSGQYYRKIFELHERFGPVVRVNPNEVHINDPEFYQEVYHLKNHKTDKEPVNNLDTIGDSISFVLDHDIHARRRQALAPYFSKGRIYSLEDRIRPVAAGMLDRLTDASKTGTIIHVKWLFAAFALDIMSGYAFGLESSTDLMKEQDMGRQWSEVIEMGVGMNNFSRHFALAMRLLLKVPDWLVQWLQPSIMHLNRYDASVQRRVHQVLADENRKEASAAHISVIAGLARSDLPAEDVTPRQLHQESMLLLNAGGETTAAVLCRTSFRVANDPEVLGKLRAELDAAIPYATDIPSLALIGNLSYLGAVVEEGLRLAEAVQSRSTRIFQTHTLQYGAHAIPPGCGVSVMPRTVSMNESIFPEPNSFRPERWLDNKALQRYQVAFSKGRRQCLGINLAVMELHLGLALLFRRFEFNFVGNTERDVTPTRDFFLGLEPADAKRLQIRITGVRR